MIPHIIIVAMIFTLVMDEFKGPMSNLPLISESYSGLLIPFTLVSLYYLFCLVLAKKRISIFFRTKTSISFTSRLSVAIGNFLLLLACLLLIAFKVQGLPLSKTNVFVATAGISCLLAVIAIVIYCSSLRNGIGNRVIIDDDTLIQESKEGILEIKLDEVTMVLHSFVLPYSMTVIMDSGRKHIIYNPICSFPEWILLESILRRHITFHKQFFFLKERMKKVLNIH
jgi:hypothetical protein